MSKRARTIALIAALIATIGIAGATGYVAFRANRPWRVLRAKEPGSIAAVRFVGDGRGIVLEHRQPHGDYVSSACEVRSIETGESIRVVDGWSNSNGECQTVRDTAVDPWTGVERKLGEGIVLVPRGDERVYALSTNSLEVRENGSAIKTFSFDVGTTRIPMGYVSPRRDAIALVDRRHRSTLGCLWFATGKVSRQMQGAELLGFNSRGELLTITEKPRGPDNVPRSIAVTPPDGDPRSFPLKVLGDVALSASGNRLATFETHDVVVMEKEGEDEVSDPTVKHETEVVVASTETGEIVRRIPRKLERGARRLALSPEGDKLAIAFEDGLVEVWEIR